MSPTAHATPLRCLLPLVIAAFVMAPLPASGQQTVPYMRDLLRLSEILGALHHLRPLCGADEQRLWRDKMSSLVATETPGGEMRQRMIGRFNRSYRELSEIHRVCSPAAREIIDRFMAEGGHLAEEIVGKYGKAN